MREILGTNTLNEESREENTGSRNRLGRLFVVRNNKETNNLALQWIAQAKIS
jgi:hypothetical protein